MKPQRAKPVSPLRPNGAVSQRHTPRRLPLPAPLPATRAPNGATHAPAQLPETMRVLSTRKTKTPVACRANHSWLALWQGLICASVHNASVGRELVPVMVLAAVTPLFRTEPPIQPELVDNMRLKSAAGRFRSRREAEQALSEIIEDGGRPSDYRIDEHPVGGFVITVLDDDGDSIAGVIGA